MCFQALPRPTSELHTNQPKIVYPGSKIGQCEIVSTTVTTENQYKTSYVPLHIQN